LDAKWWAERICRWPIQAHWSSTWKLEQQNILVGKRNRCRVF
jgi:hypothetical protein